MALQKERSGDGRTMGEVDVEGWQLRHASSSQDKNLVYIFDVCQARATRSNNFQFRNPYQTQRTATHNNKRYSPMRVRVRSLQCIFCFNVSRILPQPQSSHSIAMSNYIIERQSFVVRNTKKKIVCSTAFIILG